MTMGVDPGLIRPTQNRRRVMYDNAEIDDIVDVILHADSLSASFTKDFAQGFRRETDEETLRGIWTFVKKNIRYVRDKAGIEEVQSPGKLWNRRRGDCKSFSVFIGSILKNLGYRYKYRLAFYDAANMDSAHIYPIVTLRNGRKVVMDAVHSKFDEEVPFYKAYDYSPAKGVGAMPEPVQKKPGVAFWIVMAGIFILLTTKQYD